MEGPNSAFRGIDIDKPITFTPNEATGKITDTPRHFVNNLSNKVYYGLFDTDKYGGLYFTDDGLVIIDPTIVKFPSAAMHEVLGHRLDSLIGETPVI